MEEGFGGHNGDNNNNNNDNNASQNAGALAPQGGNGKSNAAIVDVASRRVVEVSGDDGESDAERIFDIPGGQRSFFAESLLRNIKKAAFFKGTQPLAEAQKTVAKIQAYDSQIKGLQQQIEALEQLKQLQMDKLQRQLGMKKEGKDNINEFVNNKFGK